MGFGMMSNQISPSQGLNETAYNTMYNY
jgi:hypothetical protein